MFHVKQVVLLLVPTVPVSSTSGSSSSVQGNATSKANTQVYVVATVDNSKANNTDKDTDQQADASSVEVVVADNESQPSEYASVKVSNKNVKKHSELSMPKITFLKQEITLKNGCQSGVQLF